MTFFVINKLIATSKEYNFGFQTNSNFTKINEEAKLKFE